MADGAEDYYTGHGEVPGRWLGSGSSDLNLDGEVVGDDLRAVLAGAHPNGGAKLTRGNRRVPGFDATFSAPKSVSLLWALGDEAIRDAVVAAHESSVEAALGYLERHCAVVRRGWNGRESVQASGLVAAAFRHRTSRAGDPQLHTHVLVANLARTPDGRWGTLDGRLLYAHKRTAGFLYQAQLRAELTRPLGVRWQDVHRGMADIEGIPAAVLRAFSRRRQEIEAEMDRLGFSSSAAAARVTLATRGAKDYAVDPDTLFEQWRERAQELGFDPSRINSLVRVGREPERVPAASSELGELLTEHVSHFDRRDTVRALAEAASEGADVTAIEARADRFLAMDNVVALSPGPLGMRYSTPELLHLERQVLDGAASRSEDQVGIVSPEVVSAALVERPGLSREQVRMVRHVVTSGAGVDVVVGPAGSGKTASLEAARAAWQEDGHRVIGTALSARAAAELQAGSGIPSFTLASLLSHLDGNGDARLPRRCVVVVDEAAMVGTRKLAGLLQHARWAEAKVLLVGDHRQLPEIEAGGAFAALARRLGAVTLRDNRRQRDAIERLALAALRAGRVALAVRTLGRRGRVHEFETAHAVREGLVADWLVAHRAGESAVMLATRRADVAELNQIARAALQASGELGADELTVAGRNFAVGDRVMALRNRQALGVVNGARGELVDIDGRAGSVRVRIDGGNEIELPGWYLEDGHMTHAYAFTIHKAQGMTCDRAFLLGDERLYQEAGYTGLSRARHANHLYTVAGPSDAECEQDSGHSFDLVDALRRSQAQSLASDLAVDHSVAR